MNYPNETFRHKGYVLSTNIEEADTPYHVPENAQADLNEAYKKVFRKDKGLAEKLFKWQQKYPKIPHFGNLRSVYFSLMENEEKAYEVNQELLRKFPDYIFGRINAAKQALNNNEPEAVPEYLGQTLELSALYPHRKIFHTTEYVSYYKTVFEYYYETGNLDKAREVLNDMTELDEEQDLGIDLEYEQGLLLASTLEKIKNMKPPEKDPDAERLEPTLPQTEEPPQFHLPQTAALYRHGFSTMPEETIAELLAQDRNLLRLDLEAVVLDAIRRYEYFQNRDEAYSFEEASFLMHALFLLKEIKAAESLPVVLELLRQPEDLLEYWLGDSLTEDVWQVVHTLGLQQTGALVAFLKEPLNHTYARSAVSTALSQIALHHPERRDELVQIYRDLLQFFRDNQDDETVLDTDVVSFVIGDAADFQAKELLPEIKALYDADLVDAFIAGSWKDIQKQLEEGSERPYAKRELQTYAEYKKSMTPVEERWRKEEAEREEDDDEDKDDFSDEWSDADEDEDEEEAKNLFYSSHTPFVREEPKIGRNDPCYCGSGKKYKHCHGKNA